MVVLVLRLGTSWLALFSAVTKMTQLSDPACMRIPCPLDWALFCLTLCCHLNTASTRVLQLHLNVAFRRVLLLLCAVVSTPSCNCFVRSNYADCQPCPVTYHNSITLLSMAQFARCWAQRKAACAHASTAVATCHITEQLCRNNSATCARGFVLQLAAASKHHLAISSTCTSHQQYTGN